MLLSAVDFTQLLQNLNTAFENGLNITNNTNVNSKSQQQWENVVGDMGAACGGDLLLLDSDSFASDILAAAECLKTIPKKKFLPLFVVSGVDLLALPPADLQLVLDEGQKHIAPVSGPAAAQTPAVTHPPRPPVVTLIFLLLP